MCFCQNWCIRHYGSVRLGASGTTPRSDLVHQALRLGQTWCIKHNVPRPKLAHQTLRLGHNCRTRHKAPQSAMMHQTWDMALVHLAYDMAQAWRIRHKLAHQAWAM
ncbi:hypothetical protein TanjilG_10683 [Lupinus angustifolius]|nr:hypothetical protein TanjilG_10683 [Lupinus angustifolius]